MNQSIIFGDIKVSKKSFYDSKKAIKINLIDVNNIAVSSKVKGNNETSILLVIYMTLVKLLLLYVLFYHK